MFESAERVDLRADFQRQLGGSGIRAKTGTLENQSLAAPFKIPSSRHR
jgi:hypothetical protein